jgi:hypothetical protein
LSGVCIFRPGLTPGAVNNSRSMNTPAPNRASILPLPVQERRQVLIEAAWNASERHAAATPKALVVFIVDRVRERSDFAALRLEPLVTWLGSIRDMQPEDGGKLAVGRAEVNRLLDRLIAAYDDATITTTTPNSAKAGSARPVQTAVRATRARPHGRYQEQVA